jgi:predicted RNase H-like HicB family nuclease
MIQEFLETGMHLARYEMLAGDEGFYAEIEGVQGVWANAPTLEQCREELYSAFNSCLYAPWYYQTDCAESPQRRHWY